MKFCSFFETFVIRRTPNDVAVPFLCISKTKMLVIMVYQHKLSHLLYRFDITIMLVVFPTS